MGLILERVKYNKHRIIVEQFSQEKGINIWKILLNYIIIKSIIKLQDNTLSRKCD